MILAAHKKIAHRLVQAGIWKLEPDWLWPIIRIKAAWGTRWLLRKMTREQTRDGLHHAPACPGNEWDGAYLVLKGCNCGAARAAKRSTVSRPHRGEVG